MSIPQSYETGKYNMAALPSGDQLGDLFPVGSLAYQDSCNLIWGLIVIAVGERTFPLHWCTVGGFFLFYTYLVCVYFYFQIMSGT